MRAVRTLSCYNQGCMAMRKNQAAVTLAKLRAKSMTAAERQESARTAGLVGGKRRAAALTPKRRSEIARQAAKARWEAYYAAHPEKRKV